MPTIAYVFYRRPTQLRSGDAVLSYQPGSQTLGHRLPFPDNPDPAPVLAQGATSWLERNAPARPPGVVSVICVPVSASQFRHIAARLLG